VSDIIQIPRSDAPRVSIVVPSAADPELLSACLRSLERHLPASIPTETIVVLDGVASNAAAAVEAAAPGARVVASSLRLGLARAGNRGRRMARGEFLALLHDDSEIEAGWLEALVAAADAHPEAGAVGGLVLFPDGTLQGAGFILWRDGATSPPWTGAPPRPDIFDRPRAVDFCGSSALLVRIAAWDAAGGLDDRFFPAYFVDADLAMGLRAAGWYVLFEPQARNRHRRGASSRREFQEWVSARNRAAFVAKWGKWLEAHEAWDEGSPESVARALLRAEERALGLTAGPRRTAASPAGEGTADTADTAEERRALEQDLALHRAYSRHLEAILDRGLAERDGAVAARDAISIALAAARRNEAIQSLLWWRIYLRLLPALRWLRAGTLRLSRPGSSSRTG
jgi:GT2 family glycosyltransferase